MYYVQPERDEEPDTLRDAVFIVRPNSSTIRPYETLTRSLPATAEALVPQVGTDRCSAAWLSPPVSLVSRLLIE